MKRLRLLCCLALLSLLLVSIFSRAKPTPVAPNLLHKSAINKSSPEAAWNSFRLTLLRADKEGLNHIMTVQGLKQFEHAYLGKLQEPQAKPDVRAKRVLRAMGQYYNRVGIKWVSRTGTTAQGKLPIIGWPEYQILFAKAPDGWRVSGLRFPTIY